MKKISFYFFLFLALISCNDAEILDQNFVSNDSSLDVVLENGYLSFKDDEAFNRVTNEVAKMSDQEYKAWTKSLGFVSMIDYYEPIFKKLGDIDTKEDVEAFVNKYKNQIKVEKDEAGIYSFDYPVIASLWLRVYNQDAVFKVGDILHSYKDEYIAILDTEKISLVKAKEEIKNDISLAEAGSKGFYFMSDNNANLKSATDLIDDPDHTWTPSTLEILSGTTKKIIIGVSYLAIIGHEPDGDYNISSYSYLNLKSRKRTIFWFDVDGQYRVEEFCAQVGFFDKDGNTFSNNFYSDVDYVTSISSGEAQFVFDKYVKVFENGETPERDDNCVRYINTRFFMTGSVIDWISAQERYNNSSFTFHLSYPDYQSGFPFWEYQ
ncbi:MAG: hypothetical protein ACERKD_09775 [Prolixibacteraceae bacterium]